jgi:hypothetical protein
MAHPDVFSSSRTIPRWQKRSPPPSRHPASIPSTSCSWTTVFLTISARICSSKSRGFPRYDGRLHDQPWVGGGSDRRTSGRRAGLSPKAFQTSGVGHLRRLRVRGPSQWPRAPMRRLRSTPGRTVSPGPTGHQHSQFPIHPPRGAPKMEGCDTGAAGGGQLDRARVDFRAECEGAHAWVRAR